MLINYASLVKHFLYGAFPSFVRKFAKLRYQVRLKKITKNYSEYHKAHGEWPLFEFVEIETLNRCNNICPFCPVNKNNDPRPYRKMEEGLFVKILENLRSIQYKGNVSLFSNNEPFLDERIERFARMAREFLPEASLRIFTNGMLLTVERVKNILPHIDLLYIDNYNDALKLIQPVKNICAYIKHHPEYASKVSIHLRKYNEKLSSRGGSA